jgi:hypothetical protein
MGFEGLFLRSSGTDLAVIILCDGILVVECTYTSTLGSAIIDFLSLKLVDTALGPCE